MHIPDGYIDPRTYVTAYVVVAPFWYAAAEKVKKSLTKKQIPRLALSGAFIFAVMMFNLPLPGGTTGHAVGAALAAIVFGPWAALIAVSTALAVQAVVFGDGGITTLGANVLTMGVIMPFTAAWIYRLVAGKKEGFGFRHKAAAFLAGHLSLTAAGAATGFLLGIQPLIAGEGGKALYAPYPLSVAVPVMTIDHLLFFGFIEGLVTVAALAYLAGTDMGVSIQPALALPDSRRWKS